MLALELELVAHPLDGGVCLVHPRLRLVQLVQPAERLAGARHLGTSSLELGPVLVELRAGLGELAPVAFQLRAQAFDLGAPLLEVSSQLVHLFGLLAQLRARAL